MSMYITINSNRFILKKNNGWNEILVGNNIKIFSEKAGGVSEKILRVTTDDKGVSKSFGHHGTIQMSFPGLCHLSWNLFEHD